MKLPFTNEEWYTLQTKKRFFEPHIYEKSLWPILKQNKRSCFCLQKVFRKMSTVEFISGKGTDAAACNFLETNSTAIVCRNLHIYFKQSK